MKKILENKTCKGILVHLVPIAIGALFSAMGSWNSTTDKYFYYKLVPLIILCIIYIITSIKYSKMEKDLNKELEDINKRLSEKEKTIQKLELEKNCFSRETRSLSTLCLDSSNSINELSKNILSGKRTLDTWNFKKVCTGICSSIYDVLCEVCKPYDDFTVNIVFQ